MYLNQIISEKMKTEPNKPANPFFTWNISGYGDCVVIEDDKGNKQFLHYESGLTKREYFAAMAMQGVLSSPTVLINGQLKRTTKDIASAAVIMADDLINELNK
jgi:hypothetical protein